MPLWPTRARAALNDVQSGLTFATDIVPPIYSRDQVAAFLSGWGADVWDTGDFATEPAISRAAAMSVPAVAAGRDLVVGTLAPLGLALIRDDVEQPTPTLLERPDPRFTRYEWLAWVLDDLIFESECICWIRTRTWNGYPGSLERLDPTSLNLTKVGDLEYMDCVIPRQDLVRFGGGGDGIRYSGRRIIRTALRLEQAARNDAETPLPALDLHNNGPDLDAVTKTELLDGWRQARASTGGGVAYTNSSLEARPLGWSSADRQLVEGRRYVAVEIARLMGLDAADLDAAQAGSSITYQNTVSQVRNRLQRLAGYRAAIEQRLSMPDLTPRGYTVRFDTDEISGDEVATRYGAYAVAIASGVLTVDEARAMEGRAPLTPTPEGGPTP